MNKKRKYEEKQNKKMPPPSHMDSKWGSCHEKWGWWCCVMWHSHGVVVEKWGLLQPCEQMLTAVA
jgi:hypothetical protein